MTRSKKKKNSPGSSDIHTDGICVPDPANPSVLLTFVGTWSEHDPSWEVRTLPKIPTDLLYPPPPPNRRPGDRPQFDFSRLHTDADL
jgi:hypothetical protein